MAVKVEVTVAAPSARTLELTVWAGFSPAAIRSVGLIAKECTLHVKSLSRASRFFSGYVQSICTKT